MPSCTIEGCDHEAVRTKKTLCEAHYMRLRRNGTTNLVFSPPTDMHREDCRQCGKPIGKRVGWVFCSQRCEARSRRGVPETLPKCECCGKEIEGASRQDARFCKEHKPKYKRDPNRRKPGRPRVLKFKAKKIRPKHVATRGLVKRMRPLVVRTCVVCDSPFPAHGPQLTCSTECRRARRNKKHSVITSMRRAVKRGSSAEPVDRQTVFERDGWKCHICGRRVSPKLKHPHPMSASLDHIVPLSCGGEHTYANVATAHLRCNSRKNNRPMGEQLRLVG